MKKVFVIYGNPKSSSLTESSAKAFVTGSELAGNEVRELNVYNLNFDFLNANEDQMDFNLSPELKLAQANIAWADQIVFVYPVWHGTFPAKFKSFIERIFSYGFAFKKGLGMPEPLLKGKIAVVIQSYDMPYLAMKLFFKDISYLPIQYNLGLSGIKIVKRFDFDMSGSASLARKEKWYKKIRKFAEKN